MKNYQDIKLEVYPVKKLPFSKLCIPDYQRPYKWTANNVNQLINDIITFREKSRYRLGTLVLYNKDGLQIVDGQQRVVTLSILLTKMYESITDEKVKNNYKSIREIVERFTERIKFTNKISLHNVVENTLTIDNRKNDLDLELLEFVLNKCEFVVVELNDISEAFQFFDSQNARGKDLEVHDLLKAYHLREIKNFRDADFLNIEEWQNQPTEDLKTLFLTLFRAKMWSKGKSARYFTKDNTNIFKGVSLNGGKRYPFYQMEIIAHVFTDIYNRDATRVIDENYLEFPFNLDDQIINGSRFFDMVRHYMQLRETIHSFKDSISEGRAKKILQLIEQYDGSSRTGDTYVKEMFYTLLLYYVDRFGNEELDKVVPQFFIWAYKLRLRNRAVQLASIDNYASDKNSLFKEVYDAQTPYDIINLNIDGISKIECSKCEKIKEKFNELNKYYCNE